MSKKTEELIDVLRAELNAAGLCFGVERTNDMTDSILRRVVQRLGGRSVYIRSSIRSQEEIRNGVLRDFNGSNKTEVMRKYSISDRTFYRIIA